MTALSPEKFLEYYNKLNPEQKAAVDAIEGPVMTIAGAGTGKTQILAVRIAKILQETQIDPFNILCLTFTDAGVTAMRKRLMDIIGEAAYYIKICTFHSFCNEVIKDNPEDFLLGRNFQQIDDLQKIVLLREIIDELDVRSPLRPHGDQYFYQNEIEGKIKDLKKEGFSPEQFKLRISESAHFFQTIWPKLEDFCLSKGSPAEELINAVAPEQIIPQITDALANWKDQLSATEQQEFLSLNQKFKPLTTTYLNYYQKLWTDYQNALTGQKRVDSTKRTAFKNNLKNFLTELEKNLPKQQELIKVYQAFQQKMVEKSLYDYEDMILLVSQKFTQNSKLTNGGLLRKYQEKYQYILVDEYQDTNSAQNLTVDLLGAFFEQPNIFVVGDDDQSIYRFQGASIENVINFYEKYQPQLITLTKNYRSQQSILDAAGAVISNNQTRIATHLPQINKTLHSQNGAGDSRHAAEIVAAAPAGRDLNLQLISTCGLQLTIYESETNETFGVAKQIQDLISTHSSEPKEIAVLYRNHHHAHELIELITKMDIPFELKIGQNILEDLQIGKLIKLFQTIENPNDNEKLAQTLFLDFLKIDRLDILKLSHFYYQNRLEKANQSLFQLLNNGAQLKTANLENPARLQKFAAKIADWKEASLNQTLNQFFETVIKESHYLEYQLDQKTHLENLNRLNTLFKQIKKQSSLNHQLTITDFLKQLQLRQENNLKLNQQPLQMEKNAVQLMSVHGSKGLEFEHVFLIKTTEKSWNGGGKRENLKLPKGLIKSEIVDEKFEQEEDERRLFYVALTRAKKAVHLSYAKFQNDQDKPKENLPSLFFQEIPKDLITEIPSNESNEQSLQELETLLFTSADSSLNHQEEAFLKALVETHIISPTSLNNYLTCPRKFFYQNLVRLPQAKNKAAAMGTAIHASLDNFFRQYKKTGIRPPKELLTLKYKYFLDLELLTPEDFKERLALGQHILSDYYDSHENSFSPQTITEYNFARQGVNLEGIPLTGKIDKIEATENGLIVTDFKTGNPERGTAKTRHGEDYWRQLVFYQILCDLSPRFKQDLQTQLGQGVMKVGQIEFLEKPRSGPKAGEYLKAKLEIDAAALDEVKENIRFVNQQIKALQFDKIDKSEPCQNCPFFNICWR